MPSTTDVIVVGAGPTGLTLAADLLRRGIGVRVLDRAACPSPDSRATSLTSRTLEVLDDLGVAQEMLDTGVRITETEAYDGADLTFRVSFPDSDATRFPFLLNNSQRQTEHVLTGLVERLGGRVEWETRLLGFRQERDGVVAHVAGPGGDEEIGASWLVGADGGRSTVRRTLGIPFLGPGDATEETIVLGDVILDSDLPADRLYSWFNEDGALLAFPFTEPGRWRVTAALSPAELADGRFTEPAVERLTELYRRRTGDTRTRLSDMRGFSVYRVNQRIVDHYRRGRILLAGDAAHVHTPAGGLGMNTGIQDAYALGWRLAVAIRSGEQAVVDGYERERRPVAQALLSGTGGLQRLYSIRDRRLQRVRDTALQTLLGLGPIRRAFFLRAAQLDVSYRGGRPLPWRRGVQVGDRVPDGALGTPDGGVTRLYDHLRGTGPTLLLLAGAQSADPIDPVSEKATRSDVSTVHIVRDPGTPSGPSRVTVVDADGELHRRFGIDAPTVVLVRPDGHVAGIGPLDRGAALVSEAVAMSAARTPSAAPHGASTVTTGSTP